MNPMFKRPPLSISHLTNPDQVAEHLAVLVGKTFPLTGKTRTDGSNLRKLVAQTLECTDLPTAASDYDIISKKGLPKILLEFIDTYLITTGKTYNLQVWNRIPSSASVQIELPDDEALHSNDVRFVLVQVDPSSHIIKTVVTLTPDYIERYFGPFGKPTVKHQLIISPTARRQILTSDSKVLFYPDIVYIDDKATSDLCGYSIREAPTFGSMLSLERIRTLVQSKLIGKRLQEAPTKTRGQLLEETVARILGYDPGDDELLLGSFPDIPHQALEVKIQDSPTVDLGKYTPQFVEEVPTCPGFTTQSIRYLIALTNPKTQVIEGAIVCPGAMLGKHFSYVSDESYKCQRSMPMSFFEKFEGQSVFNPKIA